jgi:hypothetical protein
MRLGRMLGNLSMQMFGLLVVCLLGGWALYSVLLGGPEHATRALSENPGRGFTGIGFMAIAVLIGLMIIGFLTGG